MKAGSSLTSQDFAMKTDPMSQVTLFSVNYQLVSNVGGIERGKEKQERLKGKKTKRKKQTKNGASIKPT